MKEIKLKIILLSIYLCIMYENVMEMKTTKT